MTATPAGHTIACRDEDFVSWHGGCRRAAVWAVEADTPGVRAAVASMRERWGGLLLPRYDRQPHITVAYGGPVPEAGASPMEEPYDRPRFEADLARLRAARLEPFAVEISGWGTFPMVPYLSAHAPALHRANATLTTQPGYVPHVTVGHYRVSVPLAEIDAVAGGWQPPEAGQLRADRLALMTYGTHDIAGPLTVEGWFRLDSGEWEPRSDEGDDDEEHHMGDL